MYNSDTGWPKNTKLLHFSISSLNIDQFSKLLPTNSVKHLLLSGVHITSIMSLHYLVKHNYSKTNDIFRRTEGPVINFYVFNLNVEHESYSITMAVSMEIKLNSFSNNLNDFAVC